MLNFSQRLVNTETSFSHPGSPIPDIYPQAPLGLQSSQSPVMQGFLSFIWWM